MPDAPIESPPPEQPEPPLTDPPAPRPEPPVDEPPPADVPVHEPPAERPPAGDPPATPDHPIGRQHALRADAASLAPIARSRRGPSEPHSRSLRTFR